MRDSTRVAGLDGLRAVACLAVFAVHLQQITGIGGKWGAFDVRRLLENGNTGVCLLFMLSGFLLGLPFWGSARATARGDAREERSGAAWVGGYVLRRLARIVPAYYLCLTALLLLGKGKGTSDALLHYAFLHNFSEPALYSINDPFWTLAVQAQLYVVFILAMLVLSPVARKRGVVIVLLAVGIAGAFAAHYALMKAMGTGGRKVDDVVRVSTLAHLPHFLLGMMAGVFFAGGDRSREVAGATRKDESARREDASVLAEVLAWASALGVLYVLAHPGADDLLRIPSGAKEQAMIGRYNFPYVPAMIAVLLVSAPRARLMRGLLELWPVKMLGVISFGIYVYHLPCLQLVRQMLGQKAGWFELAGAGLALSVVVATVSYVAVERPLARWLRKGKGSATPPPP